MKPFVTMKVVGPRSVVVPQAQVEDLESMYENDNPSLNAIVQSKKQMTDALQVASVKKPRRSKNPLASLGTSATSAVAIYNNCLERIRALKANFDAQYDPLVRMLTQQTMS